VSLGKEASPASLRSLVAPWSAGERRIEPRKVSGQCGQWLGIYAAKKRTEEDPVAGVEIPNVQENIHG